MSPGSKSVSFNANDIPSLKGKVILVTGGNNGLGKQCVLDYARHEPAELWLASRSMEKAATARDEIESQLTSKPRIKLLQLDLACLESVKKAAANFMAEAKRLDILMLNAGIMATPPALTKDGYEQQFGTNYLGHALLAKLLLPVMEKTAQEPAADVRIVALTSDGHGWAPKPDGIRFNTLNTKAEELSGFERYGQSKLASVLWANQMGKRFPQITTTSVHPGVVQTGLLDHATDSPLIVRMLSSLKPLRSLRTTVDQGARNQLWASVGKGVKSGAYYVPVGALGKETNLMKNKVLAEKLWEWTEKELQSYV